MNSLVVKRPLWYSGGILPQSREFHDQTQQSRLPIYELNGHELDEIIDEKLTNSAFVWEKLSSFLGFCHVSSLKQMLLTWNEHKIRFARIPSITPGHDNAIRKIAGNNQGARCWQRFRNFIDTGGCSLPVDPAILFRNLHPEKTFRMPPYLSTVSDWSEFRRVAVGTG